MRDIKFKGKRKYDGEWIYGYLFNNGYDGEEERFFIGCVIIDRDKEDDWDITGIDFEEVIPKTVCQYTGLKDKDGREIYENDIVRNIIDEYRLVTWDFSEARFVLSNNKNSFDINTLWTMPEEMTAVGNIFDNPELLEDSHDKNN